MSTENEKNPIVNGKELKDEAVEQVTGGLFAFNPDDSLASFTMTHQFTAAAAPAVDASVAAVANAATAPVAGTGVAAVTEADIQAMLSGARAKETLNKNSVTQISVF